MILPKISICLKILKIGKPLRCMTSYIQLFNFSLGQCGSLKAANLIKDLIYRLFVDNEMQTPDVPGVSFQLSLYKNQYV